MENNILVITDDENSKIVRTLLRLKIVPIIRRSIPSAIQTLSHLNIEGIIVEDENKSIDTIDFISNVRDVSEEIPVFISNRYQKHSIIKKIKNRARITIFDETDKQIENEIKSLVNQS